MTRQPTPTREDGPRHPLHVQSQRVESGLSLPELFERGSALTRAFYLRSPGDETHPAEELLGLGCAWDMPFDEDAGFGAAAEHICHLDLPAELDTQARLLLFGAFDPASHTEQDPTWQHFERRGLYLPELLLLRHDDDLLAIRATSSGAEPASLATWLERLRDTPVPPSCKRSISGHAFDRMAEKDRFTGNVARFVDAPDLQKVVYARRAEHRSETRIDCDALISSLNASFEDCATFALSPHPDAPTFVGATPETLVSARDQTLHTMALAGTTRGKSAATSPAREQAEAELLRSAKDRHEHQVVVEMIASSLATRGAQPEVADTPQIRRLANVSHLETSISARVTPEFGLLDALDALHPTPAVCGQPRELARQRIANDEGFDRGLYAGPIGAMSPRGAGRIFVALRCGLIETTRALLFAGAGVTAESDPQVEWDETRAKLAALASALPAEVSR